MTDPLITSPAGIIATLASICALFFHLEKRTGWTVFHYFPPLLFIYLIPVLLSNTGVIASSSEVYGFFRSDLLPMFLILMLIRVDLLKTVRVMGRGILVMLTGTLGVMIGAPIAFALLSNQIEPEMWKGFGTLAGSWIGGTGNMSAVADMVELPDKSPAFGYAVIADNAVYLVWLPIMLASRNFADRFSRFSGVSAEAIERMKETAESLKTTEQPAAMRHLLYLTFFGFGGVSLAGWLAPFIPEFTLGTGEPILSSSVYRILLVTAFGILLSFTPANRIPGSHQFAMALVYLYVARMGAVADLSEISSTVMWFILAAFIWIFIHGGFILTAAKVLKTDIHTTAIASAANIGGAASAPIVAAYHNPVLVPVSILMAMVGYAIGTPAAFATAYLCYWVVS